MRQLEHERRSGVENLADAFDFAVDSILAEGAVRAIVPQALPRHVVWTPDLAVYDQIVGTLQLTVGEPSLRVELVHSFWMVDRGQSLGCIDGERPVDLAALVCLDQVIDIGIRTARVRVFSRV